jgi:hypothetical protein
MFLQCPIKHLPAQREIRKYGRFYLIIMSHYCSSSAVMVSNAVTPFGGMSDFLTGMYAIVDKDFCQVLGVIYYFEKK